MPSILFSRSKGDHNHTAFPFLFFHSFVWGGVEIASYLAQDGFKLSLN